MTATTRSRATASDSLLRLAIRLDGVVVAALGIAMVVAAGPLSRLTGLPTAVEHGIGVVSIAYGPLAFWLASRPRIRTTGLVIAAINVATTVGLVALVATALAPATSEAGEMALAVGVYTAVIGAVQYLGVLRLRSARASAA
jgi:hypothetical protein